MAQHFLLKSKSKTLSLKEIFKLSDRGALMMFKNLRWKDTDGVPQCPHCGIVAKHWFIEGKRWKCKGCKKKFSVTSGTIFADRKLPLQDYLGAIAIFSNGAKGYSALQLSRDLSISYKSAYVLSHKLREAIMNFRDMSKLEGEVEIDGAYFGGNIKPENRKKDRVDRRKAENQNNKERAIIVIRQRSDEKKKGAVKTLTFMTKTENQNDIKKIAEKFISKQSTIHADENVGYDLLHAQFQMKRVNHSEEYFNIETKACTNQAESYFSRLRRSQIGQHHSMDARYLPYYASEIAFREDTRRADNKTIFENILYFALNSPHSPELRGYWQGNKRKKERLGV